MLVYQRVNHVQMGVLFLIAMFDCQRVVSLLKGIRTSSNHYVGQ